MNLKTMKSLCTLTLLLLASLSWHTDAQIVKFGYGLKKSRLTVPSVSDIIEIDSIALHALIQHIADSVSQITAGDTLRFVAVTKRRDTIIVDKIFRERIAIGENAVLPDSSMMEINIDDSRPATKRGLTVRNGSANVNEELIRSESYDGVAVHAQSAYGSALRAVGGAGLAIESRGKIDATQPSFTHTWGYCFKSGSASDTLQFYCGPGSADDIIALDATYELTSLYIHDDNDAQRITLSHTRVGADTMLVAKFIGNTSPKKIRLIKYPASLGARYQNGRIVGFTVGEFNITMSAGTWMGLQLYGYRRNP